MSAGEAAKARGRRSGHLRMVENQSVAMRSNFTVREPHGQIAIPKLRPAGWVAARGEMANGRGLSRREAELVTELLLRDGRAAPTAVLARRLFADEGAGALVRQLVRRARRKLGFAVIENTWGGYRIPGRFRPVAPTCCARCGSPVEWDARDWWCEDCGAGGEVPRLEVVSRGVGRRGYAAGTRQGLPWTEAEREFVLAHLDDMNLNELGEAVDRTPSAVRGFLATAGLRKPYVRGRVSSPVSRGEGDA